jgi:hypothetical protein
LVTPELRAIFGIYEVDVQSQSVVALPNSPNENGSGTESAANLERVFFAISLSGDVVPRDHSQVWYLREAMNNAAGDTHSQIYHCSPSCLNSIEAG